MSISHENYPSEPNTSEVEQFYLTTEVKSAISRHEYETELLVVEDSLGLRIETVLGGVAVYAEGDEIKYTDVTLVRSGIQGHQLTSVVIKDEQYNIPDDSRDRVSMASIPHHYLDAKALNEVTSWVRGATWSKEASVRLADRRRELRDKPQE